MFQSVGKVIFIAFFTSQLLAVSAAVSGNASPEGKTAILLASFGTTVPSGIKALDNITEQVCNAFPGTEVRITKNIIQAMGDLQEDGFRNIIVQPTHTEGYSVEPVLEGLGSDHAFAALFVENIADAAKQGGITLN